MSVVIGAGSKRTPMTYTQGLLLVVSAGVLWSAMGAGVRSIHDASAFQIVFYRSLGIMPCLVILLAMRSGGRPFRAIANAGPASILGGLGLVIAFMGSIISLLETTVANASFLWATAPLFSAVLGRLVLGEKVRRATWITIAVAAVGVLLMVVEGISVGHLLGNIAAIICALGFAGYTIALRWEHTSDTLPAVFYGGLYCTLASAVAATVAGQPLMISPREAAIAFCLGFVVVSGGLILYTFGSRVLPAAELPLLSLVEVVLSPIWVFLIFGERTGVMTLVGGAIVLLALAGNAAYGVLQQRRKASQLA